MNENDEPYEEQVAALAAVQLHPEESRHAPLPQERKVVPPSAASMAAALGGVGLDSLDALDNLEGPGALSVLVRESSPEGTIWREADGGEIEAEVRCHRIPGKPLVVAELLSVRNSSSQPLSFDTLRFRLQPADPSIREATLPAHGDDVFAPPAEGQPTPIPPSLWRPWQSGAWILPDGTVLGMLSPRTTGAAIKFSKADGNSLRGDAEFRCDAQTLAPGDEWRPVHAPFVIAASISGGEDAWRALCAQIREAAAKAPPPGTLPPVAVSIDPSRVLGPVKPVNGVGQPPLLGLRKYSMLPLLKEAGVPFSRLHDVGGMFGRGIFVDIPNLFRDFDADENDPANYDFTFTDLLVNALVENGVEPFFRLGVTLENYADIRRYRIDPPKDFGKWARICEHVIRHYTEGWTDGFRHKIANWEIWNEPDNWPEPEKNESWHGTFDEYCRLYEVASRHLKAKFPNLKIGGPASCGVAYLAGWDSPRAKHHLDCFHSFLRYVREHECPLDFFSWHSYSSVPNTLVQAHYIREKLDEAGFKDVPSILDEWLPEPDHDKVGTAGQAAEIAAGLIALQNGPVDSAAIYDARCGIGKYGVLFNPLTYGPHKAYYAFVAFNELRKLGTAVGVLCDSPSGVLCDGPCPVAYCAAARGKDGSIAAMLANPGSEEVPFTLDVAVGGLSDCRRDVPAAAIRCRIVDETRTWEEIPLPAALAPHSFILVRFEPR